MGWQGNPRTPRMGHKGPLFETQSAVTASLGSPAPAGTDWRSSGSRVTGAERERSDPMRKSNQEVPKSSPARLRCAIYTRKSTEEGLDQDFNSRDAQREAAEAFILSQRREGWIALPETYDDGGFTG